MDPTRSRKKKEYAEKNVVEGNQVSRNSMLFSFWKSASAIKITPHVLKLSGLNAFKMKSSESKV